MNKYPSASARHGDSLILMPSPRISPNESFLLRKQKVDNLQVFNHRLIYSHRSYSQQFPHVARSRQVYIELIDWKQLSYFASHLGVTRRLKYTNACPGSSRQNRSEERRVGK